jgi:peptidoglycan/LPS O-acetylase OafA/YrhL
MPTVEREHFNNFNAVRLFLAVLVIVSHAFPLSYGGEGREPLIRITAGQDSLGGMAVNLFFLISGMLITASWLRSKSMQNYLFKRILRIYPGFLVANAVSVVIAVAFSPAFRHTVASRAWVYGFFHDLVFLGSLNMIQPNAFAANPLPSAINGSLWTISIEFGCYLLVAILGLFCLFKRRKLILLFALGVWLFYVAKVFFGRESWLSESRYLSFFLAGMLCWLFRDKIIRVLSVPVGVACAGALLLSSRFPPSWSVIFPVIGSYMILSIGTGRRWRFTRWTEKTDLSYGIYLYAFPVQQVIASFPSLRYAVFNFLIALPVTAGLAWLSWHFVEEPFLRMKNLQMTDFDPAVAAPISATTR